MPYPNKLSAVRVRPARVDDADRMAEIYTAAAKEAWSGFIPGVASMEVLGARFADALAAPGTVTLVADHDGRVAGFAMVRIPSEEPIADAGELDLLYTDPASWGRGVGRALNAAVVDLLCERGCSVGVLWTAELNERPRRFYEAAGWSPDGARRVRSWLGSEFVELRYRLDTPTPPAAVDTKS